MTLGEPTTFILGFGLHDDVWIVVDEERTERVTDPDGKVRIQVKVPGPNVVQLVMEELRGRLIERLEDMSTAELMASARWALLLPETTESGPVSI